MGDCSLSHLTLDSDSCSLFIVLGYSKTVKTPSVFR